MPANIRFATENDVPEILKFIKELAVYEKLEHEVVADEKTLRDSLFGKKSHAEVLFVEDGPEKIAFALFFHNFSTFLGLPGIYLEDLYVRPQYRGKGHGKKLLAYLAKIALERGCGRLEWWVLDWNTSAIEFYESLGAQPMSEWTVHRVSGNSLTDLAKVESY